MLFSSLRRRALLSRRIGISLFAVAAFAAVLATTAFPHPTKGCARHTQERMFFGLSRPEGAIPEAEWEAFVAEVVTPRFPRGLTVLVATGQWQGRNKQVTRESSRVVEIIHDNSKDASRRVAEIAAEYKARYRQESVLITRDRIEVCG
jgi:hypothetical protein